MKLHFDYNIDKDIENFINGTRAINSKKPTKFQIAFSEKYGDNFESEKIKSFIHEQDKTNNFDANKEIMAIEERWKIAEPIFIKRVEKIFGISYPVPIITVYLTHNERCTYNIEQNYFFVRSGSEFSNNTLMHELLHFYTWHAFGRKLLDEGLPKLAYNDIKESLTELLNLEFFDLLNGKPDSGYPQHQEMRAEIKRLWLDRKSVKEIVDGILRNEKFKKKDWEEYYEITKNKPPSKLLIKALGYVANKGKAIDIGGGALKDTRYLLEQGFDVTVVDKSELMAKEAEAIKSDKLHYFVSSFLDFDFPKNEYDIASAMYALPFNLPESFDAVFGRIKQSLVKGGIFCGQCFGVRDEWSTNQKMTFHTKEQVESLLSDMEVILLDEEEKDDRTANGTPKHWHVFNFIAKKL